jgi:hypothetical protein
LERQFININFKMGDDLEEHNDLFGYEDDEQSDVFGYPVASVSLSGRGTIVAIADVSSARLYQYSGESDWIPLGEPIMGEAST